MFLPSSMLPEIVWPAMPNQYSMGHLSLLMQLEQSQYWRPEDLAAMQFRQLAEVVRHAQRTVPYYQELLPADQGALTALVTQEQWANVPLLSRRHIQTLGARLHSSAPPKAHGEIRQTATSGSTNQPVVTLGTQLAALFWRVLTLRDHVWHQRDFTRPLAAIRYTGDDRGLPPDGVTSDNWGSGTEHIMRTGPSHLLNVRSTTAQQCEWLQQLKPGYLLSLPSVLLAIAQQFEAQGQGLSSLHQVRCFGEILEPNCRATLERVFQAPVIDLYSSQEVGYIALQCPKHDHYHAQSENLLVEILDESGRPCRPGEIGRVVISTLHNFAMPLLRYDIGDYAEEGDPCDCGRGLPVLKRILGRQRNLLQLPDGTRRWPLFDLGERPEDLPPFFQFQVLQRSKTSLEVLVVRHEDFTSDELTRVRSYIQQTLGYPFEVTVTRVAEIPRAPTGKYEDFVSLVPD